jgi:hypothetical protein
MESGKRDRPLSVKEKLEMALDLYFKGEEQEKELTTPNKIQMGGPEALAIPSSSSSSSSTPSSSEQEVPGGKSRIEELRAMISMLKEVGEMKLPGRLGEIVYAEVYHAGTGKQLDSESVFRSSKRQRTEVSTEEQQAEKTPASEVPPVAPAATSEPETAPSASVPTPSEAAPSSSSSREVVKDTKLGAPITLGDIKKNLLA